MASVFKALLKGVSNYGQGLTNLARELSTGDGTGSLPAGKVAGSLALGLLAPHLFMGVNAAREYDRQRDAEFRSGRIGELTDSFKARGLDGKTAGRIARLLVNGDLPSEDRLTSAQYLQFLQLASADQDLVPFASLVAKNVEASQGDRYFQPTTPY